MKQLVVRIFDLQHKAVEISEEIPLAAFPVLAEMAESGEVAPLSPLRVELTAAREFDHVRVSGLVSGSARFVCSRCLVEYDDRLASSFVLFYRKAEPVAASPDEEVELSEVDLVSVSYEGDEIDLAPAVEEQFIMELPLKPLCREECRGLCSACGADLNAGDCGCHRGGGSLAFSALKDLKIHQ